MDKSLNIILFGETGVGKSSVINLIAGDEIAETSPGAMACTMLSRPYKFTVNRRTLRVWDTVGLDEPRIEEKNYLRAIELANDLIQQLAREGVDLLLFCIRGNRITATVQSNYSLFYEVLCRSQVPVALVVTSLERETVLEDWWAREAEKFAKYNIKAAGHACVTGLVKHRKYPEARANIIKLLEGRNADGRFHMPSESWLIQFFRMFGLFCPLTTKATQKDIANVLVKRCRMDQQMANRLAITLEGHIDIKPTPPSMQPYTFNVVLFGETGVGKSSVVNLIAQEQIAEVSSSLDGCTLESTRYDIRFDGFNFAVFDTVGLEEPRFGVDHYMDSIEKAYELIEKLTAAGGIHLLLFCLRGGRITATAQSNYRLFSECLCSKGVPIALVFTGLETETEMENYWKRQRVHVERYGLNSDGHACITTVQDETPEQQLKYMESREKVRKLLRDCTLKNCSFLPESDFWFARLGGKMRSLILKRGRKPKKKDVIKVLTERAKLDGETAKKIAEMMQRVAK